MGRMYLAAIFVALSVIDFRVDAAPVADPEADEEAELRREFDAMDLDRDGLIDRSELSQMEDAPEESDIDEFLSSFDKDGDGKISYDEIIDDVNEARDGGAEDEEVPSSEEGGFEDEPEVQ
ncbi:hypothetical protein T492DRAFT_925324 [Pavlovales sp. CCMP2436]|nr:hypothetical protein T492DRAFT_925324 [Pavlovales sp. CCMP2436]